MVCNQTPGDVTDREDVPVNRTEATNQSPQQVHQQQNSKKLMELREQVSQFQNALRTAMDRNDDLVMKGNKLRKEAHLKNIEIEELKDMINDFEERLEKSANEKQEYGRQLDEVRASLNESLQVANSRQQEIRTLWWQIDDLNREKREANDKTEQLEKRAQRLEITLQHKEQDLRSKSEMIKRWESEPRHGKLGWIIDKTKEGSKEKAPELAEQAQQNSSESELREKVSELRNKLRTFSEVNYDNVRKGNELRKAVQQKDVQIYELNGMVKDFEERLEKSANEKQEYARQLDEVRSSLNECQQVASSRQQENYTLRWQVDDLNRDKREANDKTEQLEKRVQKLEHTLHYKERDLRDIREMVHRWENEPRHEQLRFIQWRAMTISNRLKGVINESPEVYSPLLATVNNKTEEQNARDEELAELRLKCKKYEEELGKLGKLDISQATSSELRE